MRRFTRTLTAAAIGISFIGLSATPAHAVSDVSIYIGCEGRWGDVLWNASYTGSKNTKYNVYFKKSVQSSNGGSSSIDWTYVGQTTSGNLGIGSTSTYSTSASLPATVTIQVKVGNGTGSKTKSC